MQTPLKMNLGTLAGSTALEALIRRKAAWLERFHDRIVSCHVTVEAPHRHHHRGRQYIAHIRLTVPGGEIVVSHDARGKGHEDPYVAVRDAFDAARRQLEDFARVRRGDVKAHRVARRPAAGAAA